MKSGARISSIKFNDGSEIAMDRNSIVLLTGANNCGKSQSLKDIVFSHISGERPPIVIKEIKELFIGDVKELIRNLEEIELLTGDKVKILMDIDAEENIDDVFKILKTALESNHFATKNVIEQYLLYLNTYSRLIGFSPEDGRFYGNAEAQFNTKSINLKEVYEDVELENEIGDIISQSFNRGIVLNRASYKEVAFHYMDRTLAQQRSDSGKPSFARWMEAQPKLSQQGDGIISFCNIVLSILLNRRSLILIDEPESFLHPPQVRSLARFIAEKSGDDVQLVISTHSHDFVQALIDYGSERTTVIRLERKNRSSSEINEIKRLEPSDISSFWKDPLLRTSDALTSLFHHVAILVEGDSDARFFKAVLDVINEGRSHLDYKIIHCGGKDRIPKIANALRAIGVPLVCIVDIDILDSREKMEQLYEAFGQSGNEIRDDIIYLLKFVADQKAVESAGTALSEIRSIFEGVDLSRPMSGNISAAISAVVRKSSAWSFVKRSGQNFFSRGEPTNRFRNVESKCREAGIFINPYGELENLCKTVEARKGEWLNIALEKDIKNDEDLSDARIFAQQIYEKCQIFAGIVAE